MDIDLDIWNVLNDMNTDMDRYMSMDMNIHVDLHPLILTSTYTCFNEVVCAPGMDPLRVPLSTAGQSRIVEDTSIWTWAGAALDEGSDAAEWFTRYLGKPCKLVRFDTGKWELLRSKYHIYW